MRVSRAGHDDVACFLLDEQANDPLRVIDWVVSELARKEQRLLVEMAPRSSQAAAPCWPSPQRGVGDVPQASLQIVLGKIGTYVSTRRSIGQEAMRPHNFYEHPPACTCAQCTDKRLRRDQKGLGHRMIDTILSLLKGKRPG